MKTSRTFNNLYLTVSSPQCKTLEDLLTDGKNQTTQGFGLIQVRSWNIYVEIKDNAGVCRKNLEMSCRLVFI